MSKIKITSRDPKTSAESLMAREIRPTLYALTHHLGSSITSVHLSWVDIPYAKIEAWLTEQPSHQYWGFLYVEALLVEYYRRVGGNHGCKYYYDQLKLLIPESTDSINWGSPNAPEITRPTKLNLSMLYRGGNLNRNPK
jgi:hypothetical protein